MSLADCESCLSLSRQNGELRRAYDEMFKRSCEKTVYIAECEDAIDGLRAQIADARAAALEEAAKVAEAPIMGHVVMPQPLIAAAIRALKT